MNTQEKIEYLFADKEGKPTFANKITIKQIPLLKLTDEYKHWDGTDPMPKMFDDNKDIRYQVIFSSDVILDNGSNLYDEMDGRTIDDALDTLVEDKNKGIELPVAKDINYKKQSILLYIQLISDGYRENDKHELFDIEIRGDKVVIINFDKSTIVKEWTIDEFYDKHLNIFNL